MKLYLRGAARRENAERLRKVSRRRPACAAAGRPPVPARATPVPLYRVLAEGRACVAALARRRMFALRRP